MRLSGCLLLLLAAWSGATTAQTCDVEVVAVPQPVALTMEPFAGTPVSGMALLVLRAPRPAMLDLQLRPFDRGGRPIEDGEAPTVTFEPSASNAVVRRIGDDRYRFDLSPDQDARIEFSVVATTRSVPAPGQVELIYAIDASDSATGAVCLRETTVPVRVTIPSRAEMNLAGASGGFGSGRTSYSIDFGSVETGARRDLMIQFRANGDAAMSFRSTNGGRMVNVALPDYAIGYEALLRGRRLPLQGEVVERLSSARSLTGTSLPLQIVIQEIPSVPAGRYSDTITITINAL